MSIVSVPRKRATGAPDGVLVQEAAAGSGAAFATLYDRYETPVYNYCLRLLNSADDAADATQEAFVGVLRRLQADDAPVLDFAAYLYTAARNESYAVMRRRDRSRPTDSVPEEPGRAVAVETDPERSALLRDAQEEVRAANARLAPRHREVLALREVGGRSYAEIGAILGISANAAAQLLWRARSNLRDELKIGAVASVTATTEDCERAQLLIGMREDGETLEEVDERWLDEHLEECGSCRASRAMLLELGAIYGAWVPVAALASLRADVLTSAGGVIGADWSSVAAAPRHASKLSSNTGAAAAAGGVATIAAVGLALGMFQNDSPSGERSSTVTPEQENPPAARSAAPAAKAKAKAPRPERAARAASAAGPAATEATPPAAVPEAERTAPQGDAPLDPAPRDRPRERSPGPPGRPAPETPPSEVPQQPPEAVSEPPAAAPLGLPPPAAQTPAADCSHPSGVTAGCPPGHGGTPPGQGGVPPGLGAPPPGHRP